MPTLQPASRGGDLMILVLKIICGLFAARMAMFGVRWWFDFAA